MQHITALCWALGMVLLLKRVLFQACSPWWTCWWLGLPLCYTCINIHNLRSLTACTWHALRHNLYLELLLHIMHSFIADKKKSNILQNTGIDCCWGKGKHWWNHSHTQRSFRRNIQINVVWYLLFTFTKSSQNISQ